MAKFKHIVSLGFFCGIARGYEVMGLREASYPFDWMISHSFDKVLELLENGFEDFLSPSFLSKEGTTNRCYNSCTDIHFYHDFTTSPDLLPELPGVRKKYERRIERLYMDMKEPTLFVRYCFDEKEERFIDANVGRIENFLKGGNPENRMVFIHNVGHPGMNRRSECLFDVYLDRPADSYDQKFLESSSCLRHYLLANTAVGPFRRFGNKARYYYTHLRRKIGK